MPMGEKTNIKKDVASWQRCKNKAALYQKDGRLTAPVKLNEADFTLLLFPCMTVKGKFKETELFFSSILFHLPTIQVFGKISVSFNLTQYTLILF